MTRRIITIATASLSLLALSAFAELNKKRGNGPDDLPQLTFISHRLGTDHAEGIASIDMNDDGAPHLVSGRLLL